MAIKLTPPKTFRAPVRFIVPGEEDAVIEWTFVHKTTKAFESWREHFADLPNEQAAKAISAGWCSGAVINESGEEVPWSPDAEALFLAEQVTRPQDLITAYTKALFGVREKNS
jgi:hypothetical protein